MRLKKGKFYKVKKEDFMLNDIAEYHSSYYEPNWGVLHDMIYRHVGESLMIASFSDNEIYEELADGMIL